MTRKILAWLAVFAWLGVIFAFSAVPGDASGEQSSALLRVLSEAAAAVFGAAAGEVFSGGAAEWLLRKAAHVTEFAVLSVLLFRALGESGVSRGRARLALGLSVLAACMDEGHQLFVPGRAGQPADVAIDALGAAIGAWIGTKGIKKGAAADT